MKKLLGDKDANFNMTYVRKEESDRKNVKGHKMYVENPRKGVENPRKGMKNNNFSKNGMFFLCSDLYYVRKKWPLKYNKGILP